MKIIRLTYTDAAELGYDINKEVGITLRGEDCEYIGGITPKIAEFLRSIGFDYVEDVLAVDAEGVVIGQPDWDDIAPAE